MLQVLEYVTVCGTMHGFSKFDPEPEKEATGARFALQELQANEGNVPLGSIPPKPAGAAQAARTYAPRHSAWVPDRGVATQVAIQVDKGGPAGGRRCKAFT
jgi:hypothetical protein